MALRSPIFQAYFRGVVDPTILTREICDFQIFQDAFSAHLKARKRPQNASQLQKGETLGRKGIKYEVLISDYRQKFSLFFSINSYSISFFSITLEYFLFFIKRHRGSASPGQDEKSSKIDKVHSTTGTDKRGAEVAALRI